jgi:tetratricopeptide (TPR) repeat protein
MSDIRLKDYTTKIKGMIREVRLDEAIHHCQHILRHYPKHIDTYCLLGEACLERELYREAIEFFQRTLSADPENLIARVGLGVIYDEQRALPEAIWQLERAFELAPGNAEVRRELQRLYAQHGGVEKTRLRLTRGALGRLYSRNGLYERAIGEFHAVLRQDPDLPDIHVALAEALWRAGRKLDAVEVCLEILESLPNCLKANLILGEIWTRGGNEEAGEDKLSVARALDPENLVAQEMMGRDSPLPVEEVLLPELEAEPGTLAPVVPGMLGAAAPAAWKLAEEAEEGIPEAAEAWEGDEGLPDWLRDVGVVAEEEPALELEGEGGVPAEVGPEEGPPAEVPEWLQELMVEEPPAAAEEPAVDEAEIGADEVPVSEQVPPPEEMPDWLREIEASETEAPSPPTEESPLVEAMLDNGESAMMQVSAAIMDEEGLELDAGEVSAEEVPEWLQELTEPVVPPPGAEFVEEEAPVFEDEVSLAAETPDMVAPSDEELPDWLRDLAGPEVEEEAPPVEVAPSPEEAPSAEGVPSDEELPDWLRDLEAPGAEEVTPSPTREVVPEAALPPSEIPASLLALVEAGLLDEADIESAMAEMSAEDIEAQRAEEVPTWLQEMVGEEPAPVEEVVAPAAEVQPLVEEILDFEKEAPPTEEVAFAEEIPTFEEEPPVGEAAFAEEIPTFEEEPPVEEGAEWLWELAEPPAEEVVPLVEAPVEEVPPVEKLVPPAFEAPVEEVPPVEDLAPPVFEAPVEEVPPVEELAPPVFEAPVEAIPRVEEVALPEVELPVKKVPPAREPALPISEPPPLEAVTPPVVEVPEEEVPPVEEEIVVPSRVDDLLEQLKARPRDYAVRLDLARQYVAEGNTNAALTHYEKLVSARKQLPDVLGDLQPLLEKDVDRARVYQLLGDIHMQQDQLDQALEMYRQARRSLTKRQA